MKILKTPVNDRDISSLKIGDTIYLDGIAVTCRDDGHHRYLQGIKPGIDLDGLAVYHAGPIVREEKGEYKIISAGPTTSNRMESVEEEFIRKSGAKIFIGKGGMGEKTANACQKYKAIHCVYCGGCGAVAADSIEKVIGVEWLDLGMPEAMWILELKNFGPLIVSIDTCGNNLFSENKKEFEIKKELEKSKLHNIIDGNK